MDPRRTHAAPRALAWWLLGCCALVFLMIVVGGITRLTHSGLSITEWQPIVGTLPPLSDADWQLAFDKYRATPEYREVNRGMTLAAFKGIFWWEYSHRLLGRVIGVAFLVPLVIFALRRMVPAGRLPALTGIFLLGGLQGAVGWYMVKSGLVDDPRVSQFRLAAHLLLAFAIFAALFWTALSLLDPRPPGYRTERERALSRFSLVVVAAVLLMVATGAFVAGIRAGFAYNTFPLMNGALVPPEVLMLTPWWRNLFWNMATVQFAHRAVALLVAVLVLVLWTRLAATPGLPARAQVGAGVLVAVLAVQIAMGIATLLLVVPLPLAAAHQAGAVIVFAAALNVAHAIR